MAGIYNQFEGQECFVILKTEANSFMAEVHDPMPVVVTENRINDWILDMHKVDDILFVQHPILLKNLA